MKVIDFHGKRLKVTNSTAPFMFEPLSSGDDYEALIRWAIENPVKNTGAIKSIWHPIAQNAMFSQFAEQKQGCPYICGSNDYCDCKKDAGQLLRADEYCLSDCFFRTDSY